MRGGNRSFCGTQKSPKAGIVRGALKEFRSISNTFQRVNDPDHILTKTLARLTLVSTQMGALKLKNYATFSFHVGDVPFAIPRRMDHLLPVFGKVVFPIAMPFCFRFPPMVAGTRSLWAQCRTLTSPHFGIIGLPQMRHFPGRPGSASRRSPPTSANRIAFPSMANPRPRARNNLARRDARSFFAGMLGLSDARETLSVAGFGWQVFETPGAAFYSQRLHNYP